MRTTGENMFQWIAKFFKRLFDDGKDFVKKPVRGQIEKLMREEVEKQIVSFIEGNFEKLAVLMCAPLPDRKVELFLTVEAEEIVIEYTDKILGSDSLETLKLTGSYPVSRQFNTGYGHNGSGLEKIAHAEADVSLQSCGKLSGIDFTERQHGIEVSIHDVSFRLSIHGKLKY